MQLSSGIYYLYYFLLPRLFLKWKHEHKQASVIICSDKLPTYFNVQPYDPVLLQ